MLTDTALSFELCREVNDWLGGITKTYPARFAGFVMLPTQSRQDAARELERTVTEHGFRGALIDGHINGHYIEEPELSVLLSKAEKLDMPTYIHPTDPPQGVIAVYYDGELDPHSRTPDLRR